MLRLVVYFLVIAALAAVLSWLADNPGSIIVNWQGYIWNTDVFELAIILSILAALTILLWTALRSIWQSPAAIGNFFNRRREKRGLEALSSGMIAIGAGDRSLATRYAIQARKSLPNEPMTHLLRAQAAQLAGDRSTSRRIFEAMLASPDTEALGLRGLFLEAEKEGENLLVETPYDSKVELIEIADPELIGEEVEIVNKIGGKPTFIQNDEYPSEEKWDLLIQLDSMNIPFFVNFGDAGVGYGFISEDRQKAKFLWQCS